MNKMNISKRGEFISLFSTPVVKANIGRDFTEEELEFFLTNARLENERIPTIPVWKDEQKGMHNHRSKDFYLFDNHADILGDVKKFCEHELKRYMENIEGVDTDLAGLRITQSWLNKTKPSENHHLHSHTNSYISAVLYIKCLPNDSLNFDNRSSGMYNNMEFPIKKITLWNTQGATINVKEGDLLIFPSWVPHFVDVNKTKDKERISFSFNTFPIGELGTCDAANHLKL